ALRRLRRLGAPALPPGLRALAWRAAAHGQGRGIWLGGRHDAAGDRYKLYVGTGPAAAELLPQAAAWRPGSTTGLRLFHLGLEDSGRVELYWRRRRHEPGDLAALGRSTGLAAAASHLRAELATLCRRDPELALEGHRLAYSVQLDPDGRPEALALFWALSASFLGPEPATRAWLEARGGADGTAPAAALWRQGLLQPSWLGLTASMQGASAYAGLGVPRRMLR
ncbi:hypothetical protein JYK14_27460, partial [Siccirubricoccus sp. KC 17139]